MGVIWCRLKQGVNVFSTSFSCVGRILDLGYPLEKTLVSACLIFRSHEHLWRNLVHVRCVRTYVCATFIFQGGIGDYDAAERAPGHLQVVKNWKPVL